MEAAAFCLTCPAGRIYGWLGPNGLRRLHLVSNGAPSQPVAKHLEDVSLRDAILARLNAYFAGEPESFAGIPLDFEGHTAFRQSVWRAAQSIEWGQTQTYGQLAAKVGRPKGARAAGQALGANPIPIVVPCHRVLATDRRLGGYTGGLEWKRALLELEGSAYR